MKVGVRKPSIKRSIKARTTGRVKREMKKAVNPFYGKKGMGWIKDPKKALYNKVYHKTTVGVPDVAKVVLSDEYPSAKDVNGFQSGAAQEDGNYNTYRKHRVSGTVLMVLSAILIIMSALALLVSIPLGIIGIALGVFGVLKGRQNYKRSKSI